MVVLGALVREDCSDDFKARMGTIIKVTELTLSTAGLKEAESQVAHSKKWHADRNNEWNPEFVSVIRPGKVFSVRWQYDPTKVTIHVAYDDSNGRAAINLGTNQVEVVKGE